MDPETPLQEQTSTSNTENHEAAAATANVAVDKETPNALNSLDLAALQLHHLNAAQATAIAEAAAAAAAALTGRTESYQQIFASFDQNAAFAAAAAATLAACQNHVTGPPQPQPQQTKASNLVNIAPLPSADLIKRELMNQKVRADNRERKKRWRLQNEERNKDNDLRCRVNKRAHKLFGKQDSEHKKRWVKDEFEKRQQKRKEKERKRGLVDDSLSGYADYSTGNAINDNGMDLAAIAQQLMAQQHQQSQTNLTDANNYLTLLCNNLGFTGASRPSTDNSNPPEPLPQVAEELKQEKTQQQQFPLQLLELLQQLQQYQQQEEQSLKESTSEQPLELPPADDAKTEDKLAALIASTFQAVLAANDDSKSEGQVQPQANHNENNSQNTEFPMDAVLTLMQLNNAVGGNKNKW